ncbi:MAG: hypothetical protein WA160_09365 [Pseudobdellovibrio sp.]
MKKLSRYLNYLILAVVFVYGIFYFTDFKKIIFKREIATVENKKPAADVDEVVNKYIKQTANQILRDQLDTQIAVKRQLNKPMKINNTAEINPEDIPAEQQIVKESQLKDAMQSDGSGKSEQFEAQRKQDELDKKEYARQYIENARKEGYHVVLSADLKVISVTPIRKPSQDSDSNELFPSN